MTEEPSALYRLMAWLSPAYPVGAFSYSSGIEWAVESGDITDAASFRRWLDVVIASGSAFCDAVLFVHAHRAAAADDANALRSVAELAAAFVPSKERHLETTAQGRAFIEATRAAWPCAALDSFRAGVGRAGRLSGRRRCHGCRSWHRARTRALRLSARRHREPHLGGRAAHSARDRPTGSACWRRWSRLLRQPPLVRSQRRSISSAARRSAPTSPACATKPSTRGCSGRDPQFVIAGLDPAIPIRDAKP